MHLVEPAARYPFVLACGPTRAKAESGLTCRSTCQTAFLACGSGGCLQVNGGVGEHDVRSVVRLRPQDRPRFCCVACALFRMIEFDSSSQPNHTGERDRCRLEPLNESFSTDCLSLSTMLAVIGQIEVRRCFTART